MWILQCPRVIHRSVEASPTARAPESVKDKDAKGLNLMGRMWEGEVQGVLDGRRGQQGGGEEVGE